LGVRAAKLLIISPEVWQIDVGDQLGPGEWRDGREGRTGRRLDVSHRRLLTADNVSENGRRTHTEEEIVKCLKTLIVALGVTMVLPMGARSADTTATQSAGTSAAPAKCLEAVVNPVTGYAFCVNPRGAPVELPPRASLNRPCKPRVHDNDAFTVYEHWSGC
jgi:hypothetical protein